jgi:hypothetical protein
VLKKVFFETSTSTLTVTIFVEMRGKSSKVTPHGSKRIIKAGSRSKGIVMSVERARITSHWERKEQRAQSVISSISGISPSTLSTVSYGEELPLCKDQNDACCAKNRRSHFVVKAGPTT